MVFVLANNKTTGATKEVGTVYTTRAPEFTLIFNRVPVAQLFFLLLFTASDCSFDIFKISSIGEI